MNYYNPHIRLQTYFSLMAYNENEEEPKTINVINDITKIPLAVIRNDILSLFEFRKNLPSVKNQDKEDDIYHNIFIDMESDDEDFEELLEDFWDNYDNGEFAKQLLAGNFDNFALYSQTNAAYLSITPEEVSALNCFMKDNNNDDTFQIQRILDENSKQYVIKDSYMYRQPTNDISDFIYTINNAINENSCLSMRYSDANNIKSNILFRPIKIIYNADENLYNTIAITSENISLYRIDRILSIKSSNVNIPIEPYKERLDYMIKVAPNVWGNNFPSSTDEKGTFVKVRFYNEANVWNKVKKELACRTNKRIYTVKENKNVFLYYEDIVFGMNKFRSWINGYGKSAIVLEPKELRDFIIDSLLQRKKYYEDT